LHGAILQLIVVFEQGLRGKRCSVTTGVKAVVC